MAKTVVNTHGLMIGPPQWAGDGLGAEQLLRGPFQVAPAGFPALTAQTVTTSALAAIGAVSLTVTALAAALPAGTVLVFPDTNPLLPSSIAITTQDVAAAATAVPVEPLAAAVASGAAATVTGTGKKSIRSGTVVGRTIAQRDAGTAYHIPAAAAADDELRVIAFDVLDADTNPDIELYKPGCLVYENYLANWNALDAATKTKFRSQYICSVGAP